MSSSKTTTITDIQKLIISPTLTVVGKTAEPNRMLRRVKCVPPRFLSAPSLSSRRKIIDNKLQSRYSHVNDQITNDFVMPIPLHISTDQINLQNSVTSQSFFSTTKVKHFVLPSRHFEEESFQLTTPRSISRAVSMCGDRYMVKPIKYRSNTDGTIVPSTSNSKLCISSAISFTSTNGRAESSYANFNNRDVDNGPKWRKSEQCLRFSEEQEALARCRVLKRTTEVRPHRVNRNYFMTGMSLRSERRFKTDPDRLKNMQSMAQAAKEGRLIFSDNGPVIAKDEDGKPENDDDCLESSVFLTEPAVELDEEHFEKNLNVIAATALEEPENVPSDDSLLLQATEIEESADDVYQPSANSLLESDPLEEETTFEAAEDPPSSREDSVSSKVAIPQSGINRIKEMYEKYNEAVFISNDEEGSDEEDVDEEVVENEDDETESLSDDDLAAMMESKDVKLNFDKSVFKGHKYRLRDIENVTDKRSQFREVTRHLVVKDENEILQVKPDLTPTQAHVFACLFDSFDRDRDGRVTIKEIKKKLFNRKMRASEMRHFLRVFDLNKDQTIDVREFLAVAALNDNLLQQETTNPEVEWHVDLELLSYYITVYKEMFELCDITHDGRLSLEELMIIVAAGLDQDTGTDVDLMQDAMASIDRNGNGYIEFVEYLTYIPLFVQIHQRLLRRPMLIEDIERSRRLVRIALNATKRHY